MPKVSARSLEISLNKFGTGVDVDLSQRSLARIDEAMRRICRNNNNAARFYSARFIANCERGCTFNREGYFSVRVRMQGRALPRLRYNYVSGERRALLLADKLVRHPNKRQLFDVQETHRGKLPHWG